MGNAPWAAAPGPSFAPQRPMSMHDIMMWTMMQQMSRMERNQEDGGDGSGGRAGAAFRKVHRLRKRVDRQPVAIISEYLEEALKRLKRGAAPERDPALDPPKGDGRGGKKPKKKKEGEGLEPS